MPTAASIASASSTLLLAINASACVTKVNGHRAKAESRPSNMLLTAIVELGAPLPAGDRGRVAARPDIVRFGVEGGSLMAGEDISGSFGSSRRLFSGKKRTVTLSRPLAPDTCGTRRGEKAETPDAAEYCRPGKPAAHEMRSFGWKVSRLGETELGLTGVDGTDAVE